MLVTVSGQPTELAFSPASESDLNVLKRIELDLPVDAIIYAEGAYTCFELENILNEDERIHLLVKRGKAVKQRRWKPDPSASSIVSARGKPLTSTLEFASEPLKQLLDKVWVALRVREA